MIRQEREYCCDDETIRWTDPKIYVHALATMESFRADPVVALALTASGGNRLLLPHSAIECRGRCQVCNRSNASFLAIPALLFAIALFSTTHAADSKSNEKANPATQPSSLITGHSRGVVPDDLIEPKFTNYRIQPGDRISVTIWDLQGPNTATQRTTVVTEDGLVNLLVLKEPIALAGLTEPQAEKVVIKAYRDAQLVNAPIVSVNVTEPHAQSFAIVGAVNHAAANSTFPIRGFHLLNAIAPEAGRTAWAMFIGSYACSEPGRMASPPRSRFGGADFLPGIHHATSPYPSARHGCHQRATLDGVTSGEQGPAAAGSAQLLLAALPRP